MSFLANSRYPIKTTCWIVMVTLIEDGNGVPVVDEDKNN
jgi:hypothetical protein